MGVFCHPRCYPGCRRGRALGRRPPAAGPGRVGKRWWVRAGGVGPWYRSADPGRGAKEDRAAEGPVARAWHRGACYRRAPPTARQRSRYALINLAFSVVGMVLGVRSGLRNPRRLTVLAIASEALLPLVSVLRVPRAVQRRRPRIAAGSALVVAGAVARLRAAAAEPLR